MPHRNGTGARPPTTFVFESTGYEVTYRNVPLQLMNDFEIDWRRNHTPPSAKQMVEIGGEQKEINNPSNPEYQEAFDKYETEMRTASYHFLWKRAIVLSEEDKLDVSALRAEMSADGITLDPDDGWVLVNNIAGGDQAEIIKLHSLILRLSLPTREAVDDVKATFQNQG